MEKRKPITTLFVMAGAFVIVCIFCKIVQAHDGHPPSLALLDESQAECEFLRVCPKFLVEMVETERIPSRAIRMPNDEVGCSPVPFCEIFLAKRERIPSLPLPNSLTMPVFCHDYELGYRLMYPARFWTGIVPVVTFI